MPHLRSLVESLGPQGFCRKVCSLLDEGQLTVDDFSYRELADACGVLPDLRRLPHIEPVGESLGNDALAAGVLTESAPGVNSNLFRVVTGELIGRKVIEGYEDTSGFVGDRLVTTMPSRLRNQKIAGFRALAGPNDVAEGHAYEESTFDEKYVTTEESKQGRILSITEELIHFDMTGEINRRAIALGHYLRQERERTIIRGVTDAEAASGRYVYRPDGTGQPLYPADGSYRNRIGVGNTTSDGFDAAVPLRNWTDIDRVLQYRATQIVDDRIDGEPRPLVAPVRQMLVPESLRGIAVSLISSSEVTTTEDGTSTRFANPMHNLVEVFSSPFIDEQGGSSLTDWYLGDFRRQFVWTEIWPVQTFLQQSESHAAFERDVVLRVKVRSFGGLSATDTVYVTKVQG